MEQLIHFFAANTPTVGQATRWGPPALAWSLLALSLAGWLKRCRNWPTGYTRKVFHFLIFGSVAAIHATGGTQAVCLLGAVTSVTVFFAVWLGRGHLLYEAMAREKDEPHRTLYILTPWLATFLGGVISNVLFGPWAITGYLVTGFGDAVGEPIGTRFGKHVYRVPALRGVPAVRTLEGSTGVFVASAIATAAGIALVSCLPASPTLAAIVLVVALASTVIEAVSPHGWDNLTMQIVPAGLTSALVGGMMA